MTFHNSRVSSPLQEIKASLSKEESDSAANYKHLAFSSEPHIKCGGWAGRKVSKFQEIDLSSQTAAWELGLPGTNLPVDGSYVSSLQKYTPIYWGIAL